MSLYRFSIYVQLFGCIGASMLICDCTRLTGASIRGILIGLCAIVATTPLLMWMGPRMGWLNIEGVKVFINSKQKALTLFFLLSCAPAVHELITSLRKSALRNTLNVLFGVFFVGLIIAGWNRWIGLTITSEKTDHSYIQMAEFAKQNTPVDAIFLTPPDESEFRLRGERAVIVNFKAVPQLGGELKQWSGRLKDVLGLDDLTNQLPNGFDKVGPAMRKIYNKRTPEELFDVARKYEARYVIATHDLGVQYDDKLIHKEADKYFLYDLGP
jgi:hypothetical protein